ncbi:MAG: YggS family pyridoxal phosphate-dependent enzyme [Rhodothermia bacterium]|nr:YggS family pyridoxal phosphate-dependent enzyme [Rhodothermia bacterium]
MESRAHEIRRNIEVVFERVRRAAERAGRRPDDITVVAVSKKFSIEDIRRAYESGIRDFGENRVQELVGKVDRWAELYPGSEINWHMVGHLQRNKVKELLGHCSTFHALDSLRLATALNQRAGGYSEVIPCLAQVNVSGEDSKFGWDPDDAESAVREILNHEHLQVIGLMTLARPVDDPEHVRPEFAKLRRLYERIQSSLSVKFEVLSMGMSGDFEVAIEEGATHVRVGTAIFGERT